MKNNLELQFWGYEGGTVLAMALSTGGRSRSDTVLAVLRADRHRAR